MNGSFLILAQVRDFGEKDWQLRKVDSVISFFLRYAFVWLFADCQRDWVKKSSTVNWELETGNIFRNFHMRKKSRRKEKDLMARKLLKLRNFS